MLDYAANGINTWENDLRDAVARAAGDLDPAQYLEQQLGVSDAEAFWSTVESRRGCGRLALLFGSFPQKTVAPGILEKA